MYTTINHSIDSLLKTQNPTFQAQKNDFQKIKIKSKNFTNIKRLHFHTLQLKVFCIAHHADNHVNNWNDHRRSADDPDGQWPIVEDRVHRRISAEHFFNPWKIQIFPELKKMKSQLLCGVVDVSPRDIQCANRERYDEHGHDQGRAETPFAVLLVFVPVKTFVKMKFNLLWKIKIISNCSTDDAKSLAPSASSVRKRLVYSPSLCRNQKKYTLLIFTKKIDAVVRFFIHHACKCVHDRVYVWWSPGNQMRGGWDAPNNHNSCFMDEQACM
jgi:hypothetical protein